MVPIATSGRLLADIERLLADIERLLADIERLLADIEPLAGRHRAVDPSPPADAPIRLNHDLRRRSTAAS